MNVRHPMGVSYSFSIKNIFYNKMELMLFYFCDGLQSYIPLAESAP